MDHPDTVEDAKRIIEALIFSTDTPLSVGDLSSILDGTDPAIIEKHIEDLNADYENTAVSFNITMVAGGYQFVSRPEYARWIKRLYRGRIPSRLTQAALECLAIVAYKQPISRTSIESIRGVNVDGVIRTLLDRNLVRIAGRGEGVGRPILYATTPEFLKYFGLNQLNDLPKVDELKEILRERDEAAGLESTGEPVSSLFPTPHLPEFDRDETE